MILSASRRTDIPCCYPLWFMNRIRAGYLLTRNPMNPAQLSRIALSPEIVDCIVFWTKDATPLLPYLKELDGLGYRYYFQFTLTPYGKEYERNLRPKEEIEDTFLALSRRVGRTRVVWRYDPIIINEALPVAYHKAEFLRLCQKLSAFTDTVVISFVDLYAKLKTDLLRPIAHDEIAQLAAYIGKTAKEYGLRAVACCEKDDLTGYAIAKSSCIDRQRIEAVCGCALSLRPDKNQRTGCGCVESVDIGAYNTCTNGCVYCYANSSPAAALRRHDAHDPQSELLTGAVCRTEEIKDRKAESNRR